MKINKIIKPCNTYFKVFLCLIFCFVTIGNAQNKGENKFSTKGISKIVVDGYQIFNIDVETSGTDTIKVFSLTDGEYKDDFKVFSELKNGQLNIGLRRSPFYDKLDDKRNAHKVIAATLKIILPEDLDLSITSDIGSVNIKGDVNMLFVQLAEGYLKFEGKAKSAIINTIDGDIHVTTNNAMVEATSSYGNVNIDKKIVGNASLKLKSIHGNVTVTKKEE